MDSVIYQKGIAKDKPLLAEYSALPQLQSHLTGLTKRAGETLWQARETERNARRQTLQEQFGRCKDFCLERMANLSTLEQQDQIKALFAKMKEMLEQQTDVAVTLYGGLFIPGGSKTFEGKMETR